MKLVCQQCNHENELERIYCHNCGTKLDRSQLPVEKPKTKKKARSGPPVGAVIARKFAVLLSLLIGSAVLAAILCIFKPIEGEPEITDAMESSVPPFTMELESLAASATPASRPYADWQVNAMVKSRTKARKSDAGTVKVSGGWVKFEPDKITVVGKATLFGLPTGFEEVWEIKPDNVPAKPRLVGARIGRLSIPAAVASPVVGLFSKPFYKRFETEMKALKTLGAKVEKEKVTVFSGPSGGA